MAKAPSKPAVKPTTKPVAKPAQREAIYPTVTSKVCSGETAITVQQAKELLGWQEETEAEPFKNKFMLQTADGTKVRCNNNRNNREFKHSLALKWTGEILKGNWQLNGETIIIGCTGQTLSAQHRLVGLVMAGQEWAKEPSKWPFWQEEPTLQTILVTGICEGDATVNTIDTAKPRSLADVLYRSPLFAKMQQGDRSKCARITEAAIGILRERTGATLNAFSPGKPTHSDSVNFLDNHLKLVACVKHIYEENGEDKIHTYLPLGEASALMFLMGCCTSDQSKYKAAETPCEKLLDWATWTKAENFWVQFAGNDKSMLPIRTVLGQLGTANETGKATNNERRAVMVQAWNAFANGQPITESVLELAHVTDQETLVRKLVDCPVVGGIDIGSIKEVDEVVIAGNDPTAEEIAARKKAIRSKNGGTTTTKPTKGKKMPAPSKAGEEWAVGDTAWVYDKDGEHYLATITTEPWQADDGEMLTEAESTDGLWEVNLNKLSLEKPAPVAPRPSVVMPKTPALAKHVKNAKAKPTTYHVNQLVWINDPKEPFQGRIMEIEGKNGRVKIEQGFQGSGNIVPIRMADVSLTQPE